VAVRWNKNFTFYDAIMLPKSAVLGLYAKKVQSNGTAHISWVDWKNHVASVSLAETCRAVLLK
jgi:hypothetical protein